MPTLVVSACLLGRRCRYDGADQKSDAVATRVAAFQAAGGHSVSVCPEELGELGTPRPPAQLVGGDGEAVLGGGAQVRGRDSGLDVTAAFVDGAARAADRAVDATHACLKARSPSCGVGSTWIDGELRPGDGVFAALLRRRGVVLSTDEDA
jgi:uncharacterized protein YbbK (DUF523 family)